ncbi:DUF4386 domain-containing protein [Salmonirosea aquatica]|uniref:DUF4386 family protein n=1 Tax=Salmonirosea aquatica TaxID=2654236 RepID=A0A7C9BME1_9BACT|nr:DUF4386 family protein [Cytophagaceae bacterium SJW1-29]
MEPLTEINKRNAITTSLCFIVAAVTSIVGKLLYAPVLADPDYLTTGFLHSDQVVLGAVFELILATAAVGTGIFMYPILRKVDESLGLGYVIFRTLEVVFILVGLVGVLALITLSKSFTASSTPDYKHFHSIGEVLKGVHDWAFILGPNFMLGINTFVYSFIFYRSALLPRKIALLGLVAAILICVASLLELFGVIQQVSVAGFLFALPIFIYEMIVAIWLLSKGFGLKHGHLISF